MKRQPHSATLVAWRRIHSPFGSGGCQRSY